MRRDWSGVAAGGRDLEDRNRQMSKASEDRNRQLYIMEAGPREQSRTQAEALGQNRPGNH